MAFTATDLSVLAYANNWHYTTEDSSVTTGGYFNKATEMLREQDLIIANVDTGGSPDTTFYVVTGNDGTTVTIAAYA